VNHLDPRPRQRDSLANANPLLKVIVLGIIPEFGRGSGSRARVFFKSPCPHFLLSISNGRGMTMDAMRVEPPLTPCARGVGDYVEEDARAQIDTFRQGFDQNV
jgi:hypothetical protein